jgi:hypothetical protein
MNVNIIHQYKKHSSDSRRAMSVQRLATGWMSEIGMHEVNHGSSSSIETTEWAVEAHLQEINQRRSASVVDVYRLDTCSLITKGEPG